MTIPQRTRFQSAVKRMKYYKWENSRAYRTGSRTKEQWQEWTQNEMARLAKRV